MNLHARSPARVARLRRYLTRRLERWERKRVPALAPNVYTAEDEQHVKRLLADAVVPLAEEMQWAGSRELRRLLREHGRGPPRGTYAEVWSHSPGRPEDG